MYWLPMFQKFQIWFRFWGVHHFPMPTFLIPSNLFAQALTVYHFRCFYHSQCAPPKIQQLSVKSSFF